MQGLAEDVDDGAAGQTGVRRNISEVVIGEPQIDLLANLEVAVFLLAEGQTLVAGGQEILKGAGATFLARALGLRGAAWNLESACSSTLLALETACSLVRSGVHRNILVVTSCTYSRATREDDPISWGVGDAATAMVVGPVIGDAGLLGTYSVHSAETCEAVAYHLEEDDDGHPHLRMRTGRQAARLLREASERYLLECVGGVLGKCGLGLPEIDAFVFHTPLAWYARFCARALGVDPAKTLDTYPLYANAGPSLVGLNLIHAAHWRPLEPHHLVLLYTVGSVSSCAAAVVRWGDVALGALPRGATPELLSSLEQTSREGRGLVAVA